MSVVLSEHLPLLASAPDGIEKLRGLILELAVRGKLVPQDPNDEPASELLRRIDKERARLEGEGICKKSKATALGANDAPPFELPSGWALSQLSDLTMVLNGRAYSKNELLTEGVPVLRVGNLFTSNHWYYSNLKLEDDKYCDQGDLLYSWSASFGPFIWQGPKVIYHYHIWKLRLFDESSLCKEFFYKFLLEKTAEIKAAGHGVSMIHMTKEKMEKILVPVPPLAEQHRIVAKVDELMTLCDRLEAEQADAESTHARLVDTLLGTLTESSDAVELADNWQRLAEHFEMLFTTESSLDGLKQTILQLAVMGKLVPQDPNDEPASELLKRIAKERARLEAEGGGKKLKLMLPVDESNVPFGLPSGWAWARFPEVGQFGRGKSKHRPRNDPALFNPGIYPLIQTGEVARAGTIVQEIHSKYSDVGLSQSKMWPQGTLCVTIAANIADSAILGFDACFPDSVVGFVPSELIGDSYYFLWFMKTAREELLKFAPSTAQKNINLEILESVRIPLPPKAEMKRIVSKVDELMVLNGRLKADLAESRTRQARLSATLIESALHAA